MSTSILSSTLNGQLQKASRVSVPIRLTIDDHKELKLTAEKEQRSMSFIAMRRYLIGRTQEPSDIEKCNKSNNVKGI